MHDNRPPSWSPLVSPGPALLELEATLRRTIDLVKQQIQQDTMAKDLLLARLDQTKRR